jgi:uncharacterized protein involved in exopolysaccharide biosynthesis
MKSRASRIFGTVLLCCGLVSCVVGLWLLLQPSRYRATTRIKVERDFSDIQGLSEHQRQVVGGYDPYFTQTEFEVIQSETILGKVVELLDLNTKWGGKRAGSDKLNTMETVRLLRQRLTLRPVRGTSFIEIRMTSENPDEAARIANAIAETYRDHRLERRRQLTLNGIKSLEMAFQEQEKRTRSGQEKIELLQNKLKITEAEMQALQSDVTPQVHQLDKARVVALSPYLDAKRELENLLRFGRVLEMKIAAEKIDQALPKSKIVEFVEHAVPPTRPASPNRFLGAGLLIVGIFFGTAGLLLCARREGRQALLN